MSLPNRSTKLKVAFGYILLTALLFISIGYIYQEMKSLSGTGDDEAILSQRRHVTNQIIGQLYQAEVIGQSLSTGQIEQYYRYQRAMKQATTALDSLRTLLTDSIQLARLDTVGMLFMDKERNMRNLLKAIQDGGTDILYKQHIDELIAQQDSLLSLPHVRKKVITHTNSYIIRKKPKSFFKRLGEVFSPGKADSTQVNNVIQEEYTDTLTEAYSPADTVVTMLKNIQSRVTDTQQERMEMVNRRTQSLRLSGLKLSQKVNQLLSTIEEEEQALAQNKHIQEEYIRQSSIRTVAGIAIVAVVLAIFFLVLIWRDITRSNHYRREQFHIIRRHLQPQYQCDYNIVNNRSDKDCSQCKCKGCFSACTEFCKNNFADDNGCKSDYNGTSSHINIGCSLVLCVNSAGKSHKSVGDHKRQNLCKACINSLCTCHLRVTSGCTDRCTKLSSKEPVNNCDQDKCCHDQLYKKQFTSFAGHITKRRNQFILHNIDCLIGFSHDSEIHRVKSDLRQNTGQNARNSKKRM